MCNTNTAGMSPEVNDANLLCAAAAQVFMNGRTPRWSFELVMFISGASKGHSRSYAERVGVCPGKGRSSHAHTSLRAALCLANQMFLARGR